MKAYVLNGVSQLNYMDVEEPELKEGWALVQVGAAGICESDVPRIYRTGTYHFPTIPGHEFAGKVVKVCDEENSSWIGKRVGIFPLIPCRECFVCKEGRYEMCRNYDYLGSRRDGGFAEYVAVPVWNLIELPEKMLMEEGAMLEPASVARHAVQRLEVTEMDTVALFGLGTIGILITQWLRMRGVNHLYAVGHHEKHGEIMRQTASEGYEYYNDVTVDGVSVLQNNGGSNGEKAGDAVDWIMEKTGGIGVSIAIDCVGSAESFKNCLNAVKPGGQILIVGNPKGDMELDKASYWKILRNQIRLTGTWNSTFNHSAEDDWHKVIEACCEGSLKLTELITHRHPFEELERGLLIARDKSEYRNKIVTIFKSEK